MRNNVSAGLSLAFLLSGCSVFDPGTEFDPRVEQGKSGNLEFSKVDVRAPVRRSDLTPHSGSYRIGAGDELQIEVVEAPDTRARSLVMPDGYLYFDSAPGIRAVGKTIPELESELEASLRTFYTEPAVNVNPVSIQGWVYSVMGQVVNPGVYDLAKPVSVLEAFSRAGGFRSSEVGARPENLADLERTVLLRQGEIMAIDFRALVERGAMQYNVYLRPGDYLFVAAEGANQVYVLGNVPRAGAVPYSGDLTLVEALASAGGFGPSTYRRGLLLVRDAGAPAARVARIDMVDVVKGVAPDFRLEPNDVIWVPKDPWKKLGEYSQVAVVSAISTIAVQAANQVSNGN